MDGWMDGGIQGWRDAGKQGWGGFTGTANIYSFLKELVHAIYKVTTTFMCITTLVNIYRLTILTGHSGVF